MKTDMTHQEYFKFSRKNRIFSLKEFYCEQNLTLIKAKERSCVCVLVTLSCLTIFDCTL